MFVVIFATHTTPPKDRDFADVVRDFLLETNNLFSFGYLLGTIAVIGYVLDDRVINAGRRELATKKAAENDPKMQKIALQMPLQARHFEQSLADWTILRNTVLTPERLRDFEDILFR